MEVPKAPAVMRAKLDKPEAAGMRSGGRSDMISVMRGTKKKAIATPWMMVGISKVETSACVLNCERIQSTRAKVTKAMVERTRGSTRWTFLPTMGVQTMASRPTGARTKPAQVAVYPMYCCNQSGSNTTLPKKVPKPSESASVPTQKLRRLKRERSTTG